MLRSINKPKLHKKKKKNVCMEKIIPCSTNIDGCLTSTKTSNRVNDLTLRGTKHKALFSEKKY